MKDLRALGVGTQVHYIPVHSQPYYADLYGVQDMPGADAYYKQTLSLPLYPSLQDTDIEHVVASLKEVIAK